MAEEGKKQEQQDDIDHYIKLKLYSIPYVNDKGYRIGNYHIEFDTKNSPLPFSSFDQVDHFLINLFKYAKEVPNNKEPTAAFNKKFFKHHKKNVVLFKPIKYEKAAVVNSKGGRKTKNYARRRTKSKSIKNRTRKNR